MCTVVDVRDESSCCVSCFSLPLTRSDSVAGVFDDVVNGRATRCVRYVATYIYLFDSVYY